MHSDDKNEPKSKFDSEFIDVQTVADYYEVNCETVKLRIRENRISGKQLEFGKYLVSTEEFEYLKAKRDRDNTDKDIRQLLGDDYCDDWEVKID
ncbi:MULTISPECIES: hypothetical protein [Bacillus]|uniref:hypothetical protein n=1 Tax=Bacillus TaxID=1386 RepID=UPI0011B79CFC|nr:MULTISPECIES: hypothetical protein [Bacillus]MEC3835422.1 hypothetical protein [Bacillus licheniformis]